MTFRLVALAAALLALAGCGTSTPQACSASNCAGCCDLSGQCQLPSAEHCGASGNLCTTCFGNQICSFGVCLQNGAGGGNSTGGGGGSTGGGGGSTTGGGGGSATGGGGGSTTGGGGGSTTGGGGGSVTGGGGGSVTGGGGGSVTGGGGGSTTGGGGGSTGGGGGASCTNCAGCCSNGTCVTAISTSACGSNGAACTTCDLTRADNCDTGGCSCGAQGPCAAGSRCVNSQCVCDATSCGTGCCQGNSCVQTLSTSACGTQGAACTTCDTTVANNCGTGSCRCGTGPACSAGQRCFNSQCVCDSTSCATGCCAGSLCVTGSVTQCGTAGGSCAACDARADNCGPSGCRCGTRDLCPTGVTCTAGSCGGAATWTLVNPATSTRPSARSDHMLAYDGARQRLVLFGGETTGGLTNGETWEYAPATATWTQRVVTGPSARRNAVMVFDRANLVTVLFGGDTGSTTLGDTWIWNGTTWTQLTPTSAPSPRYNAGGAWDPVRQRVVIFGGTSGTANVNDVWEWNGTTWAQRTISGTLPSARSAMGMAYDSARSRLVIFGGYDTAVRSDTWELGTTWQQITSATLSARRLVAMDFHVPSSRVIIVGGTSGSPITGSAAFDGSTWTALASTPTERGWSRMVWDSTRGKLVLFGGFGGNAYLQDLWEY